MGFFSRIKRLWKGRREDKVEEYKAPSLSVESEKEKREGKRDVDDTQWKRQLRLELQSATPKLSIWLDILLQDIGEAGDKLWERLFFLFETLDVPPEEARSFVDSFKKWLKEMEYSSLEEFRSELQYRLALALDLEDEEDEQSRLFLKLSEGLSRTKEHLTRRIDALLSRSTAFDEDFWEEMEEILIMADVGFNTTLRLVERLKIRTREEKLSDPERFKEIFKEELALLIPRPGKRIRPLPPEVVLMLGVNGVGKTTTIAKLAYRETMQGKKVMLAAGDTFRAAAIEQLEVWAKRIGCGFYAKEAKSDPAAVAYEALARAKKEGYDVVFVDTAGRLHTKVNLMEELKKIKRVLGKQHAGAPHRTVLVLDATTGQNALSQVKLFNEAVGVDEIILTKLDGTAKGGVVLGICVEYNIPITYVGLGEKMEDMRPFDPKRFAEALLG